MRRRRRKLVVGDRTYWFSLQHLHDVDTSPGGGSGYRGCREKLLIRRDAGGAADLIVTFVGGPGRGVGDAINPSGVVVQWIEDCDQSTAHGVVARPRRVLNLHRPGVVRAILDEAIARGWNTMSSCEVDGWEIFEAVRARLGPETHRE